MIPKAFAYVRPTNLAEAAQFLANHAAAAKILAGGHSLLPMMKLRLASPAMLIDIGRLEELNGIHEQDGNIVIGACTTHYAIETSSLLAQRCPLLVRTAAAIGDIQVRNRGTLGGSMAHADPAGDWPAAALALQAQVKLVHHAGERMVAADDFFVDLLTTALDSEEILAEIQVPVNAPRTGSAYVKVPQPASGFALVGIAAQVRLGPNNIIEQAGIGITGVANIAFRARAAEAALQGQFAADETTLNQAASYATADVESFDDIHASADYRLHLARVYTKRALQRAIVAAQE
jgi:carbon-monoxide dehydrogenase medium subunit